MPARRKNQIDPLELSTGDPVVHSQHGVGRYVEMTQRSVAGSIREYLVIEYAPSKRGQPGDRLYVPMDSLDQVTRYVGGENPTLDKMGGGDWAKRKGRARKAVREIAAELIKLYAARQATRGPRLLPRHDLAARAGGRLQLRRDPRPAGRGRRGQARHGADRADGPADLRRRRATARPRSRSGPRSRRSRTASRWRSWSRPRCWSSSTTPPSPTGTPASRSTSPRSAGSSPTPRPGRRSRVSGRQGRRGGRHPPAARQRDGVRGPRPGDHRRGAALRRRAQGAAQATADGRRRAGHVRHPDPAHAGDGDHRHPGDEHHRHPAGGAASGADLRRPVRRGPGDRRRSVASCSARARSSTSTTGCRASTRSPGGSPSWFPRPGWSPRTAR